MIFFRKARRIAELEKENAEIRDINHDLDTKLFEMTRFHELAEGKLTHWVTEHDKLLLGAKKILRELYGKNVTGDEIKSGKVESGDPRQHPQIEGSGVGHDQPRVL